MTTTIGTQLRPYVAPKPKEEESTPCETYSFDIRMGGAKKISLPEGKIPHSETHPSLGVCPNEATWEGMCPLGDTSANVCDECHTRLVLGETESTVQQRKPHGRITMLFKDCRELGYGDHPPHHEWSWFKK
jgi:hypothetical protein